CSNTVTGTPRRLSASAHTMPTGPAPTMTTRFFSVLFDISFDRPVPLSSEHDLRDHPLLRLQSKITNRVAPQRGVVGDDLGKLLRRADDRLGAEPVDTFDEVGALLRRDDHARQRLDDVVRHLRGSHEPVDSDHRRALQRLQYGG